MVCIGGGVYLGWFGLRVVCIEGVCIEGVCIEGGVY